MKISNLANQLRDYGLTVVEVDGWASRGFLGQDLQEVRGILWHHTATNRARFVDSDAPTLAMCINGRPDVAGPLCNIVFGRTGVVYMVAAGVANHAGRGVATGIPRDMGNHYLIGIEMESSGIAPWDWTPDQIRVAPHLGAALERITGAGLQISHAEYSSEGKIDPAGWPGGMSGLRDQINAVLNGATTEQDEIVDQAQEDRIIGRIDELNKAHQEMTRRDYSAKFEELVDKVATAVWAKALDHADPTTAEVTGKTGAGTLVTYRDFHHEATRRTVAETGHAILQAVQAVQLAAGPDAAAVAAEALEEFKSKVDGLRVELNVTEASNG